MSKIDRDEYRDELQTAMRELDEEGRPEGFDDLSEAEQLAHLAERPKRRIDGSAVGSSSKRPKPLSTHQQLFVQGVIRGKSLRQAYRDAYANDTGSDASISASANKLMKDPRVKHLLESAWEETIEHLSEDIAASKRYVLKGLLALSKEGKQEGSRLKALELMGKACGLFTPTEVQDKAVISADQLRKELAGHLKLLQGATTQVQDVEALRFSTQRSSPEPARVNDDV
jgi:hypothetical protein